MSPSKAVEGIVVSPAVAVRPLPEDSSQSPGKFVPHSSHPSASLSIGRRSSLSILRLGFRANTARHRLAFLRSTWLLPFFVAGRGPTFHSTGSSHKAAKAGEFRRYVLCTAQQQPRKRHTPTFPQNGTARLGAASKTALRKWPFQSLRQWRSRQFFARHSLSS